jgi:hypothetical protein
MWSRPLPTGDALDQLARRLGVITYNDTGRLDAIEGATIKERAQDAEIQRRVMDAQRHLRENRVSWFATGSAVAVLALVPVLKGSLWLSVPALVIGVAAFGYCIFSYRALIAALSRP